MIAVTQEPLWAPAVSGLLLLAVIFIPVAIGSWREIRSAYRDIRREIR